MTNHLLTVYYDGACHLCSREIEHYRKRDTQGRLKLVDISAPGFVAEAVGLDRVQVQKVMHVRLADGSLVTGLQAFIAIWGVLPGMGRLAKVAQQPLINPLLRGGYLAFAALRPYLPKRKRTECADGSCAV
jgi:predicted DCC family thiol-disulfide oxidoreductase YuxK